MTFPDLMPRQSAPVPRTTGVQASQERAGVEASSASGGWIIMPFAGVEASWSKKTPFVPFAGVEASLINPDPGNSPFSGVDAE